MLEVLLTASHFPILIFWFFLLLSSRAQRQMSTRTTYDTANEDDGHESFNRCVDVITR